MNYLNVSHEVSFVTVHFITHWDCAMKLLLIFFSILYSQKSVCIFAPIQFVLSQRVPLLKCLTAEFTLEFFSIKMSPMMRFEILYFLELFATYWTNVFRGSLSFMNILDVVFQGLYCRIALATD